MIASGLRSAHRHHQGHGRGDGTDHRGGPGAVRRVRAVRLHQRHHRPVLPPVRRDHLRLDGDLGDQRHHHDALAGRADLQEPRAATRTAARRCRGGASPWWAACSPPGMAPASLSIIWAGRTCSAAMSARFSGLWWAVMATYFTPGALVGGLVGWVIITSGERRAGLAVPRLQPPLRRHHRGLRLDRQQGPAAERHRAGGLRRPARLDLLGVSESTDRLHPAAGPGPAHRQHPAARLGLACSAPRRPWPRSIASRRDTPGVGARNRPVGTVVSSASQQPQLRLDVHRPRSRSTSGGPRTCATRPSWPSCGGRGPSKSRTPRSPSTEGRRSPDSASPAASSSSSRIAATSAWRPCRNRPTKLVRKLREQPGLNTVSTQIRANTPQLFLDIDRTKVAALGVSLDDVNQTLDMYHGLALRQQLQRFRPALAGHHPGGGRIPQSDRGPQSASSCGTNGARWSRWAPWSTCARSADPSW